MSYRSTLRSVVSCAAPLLLVPMVPASANVIFGTSNIQYDNVNIAADIDALTVTGDIAHTPATMTFNTMIGPDRVTQVTMHCQHGVAFCESQADSVSGADHTGFSSITLTAETGTTWDAGDFKLDELAGLPDGTVTFTALDALGNPLPVIGSDTFAISGSGQNPYNFFTTDGEVISSLIITTNDPVLLQDIKQVSLEVTGFPVPEPGSLALIGAGLTGLGLIRRRRSA